MIRFEQVWKVYPSGVEAVRDLSLEVREGETLVLLGTSGSGKTTTMKMVNRLIDPTRGTILINGQDIMRQDPIRLRRQIGYAIQSIGLFPHMTVGDNVAVVPRLLGWPADRTAGRIDALLRMVGLEPAQFRARYPSQLSGGQMQRVGVARALAADPPIVLMDEPFGALDPITRELLQNEFLELQAEMKKTILFVTHDVFEAAKMGDRVAVLDAGRLQQLSPPSELVERPSNEFVDRFLGTHRFQLSLLTRTLASMLGGGTRLELEVAPDGEPPADRLRSRNSLIEALDMFKRTSRSELPVYEGRQKIRDLTKRDVLRAVAGTLGELGGAE